MIYSYIGQFVRFAKISQNFNFVRFPKVETFFSRMNSFPGVPFQRFQARQLLRDKYVLIIGDSVQRGVYKGKFTLNHQNKVLLKNRFIVLSYSRKHKDSSFEWLNF